MKILRLIIAITISVLVLDAASFQNLSNFYAIEIPIEEPADEDVVDDSEDDKEHVTGGIHIHGPYQDVAHYTNYMLNHTHQVQETFSPPPEL
jgi:hypothetical protein